MVYYTIKLITIISLCTLTVYAIERTCGKACHEIVADKINVHLVPHTHNDVGWLKTVDQYYYGSSKRFTPFGVQYILDSVVSELERNENRRFVYAETAYFWTWWDEQVEDGRKLVRKLVQEGRLEFLHGGWCMTDEATPHYTSTIDQMTLGLRFLNDTFGDCGRPAVSWQIDSFGHSSELAVQFAEMGFDGLFVSRIDHDDHKARRVSKALESIWRPDPALVEAGDLFTSVLLDSYTAPTGFCFDVFCSDEPIMDRAHSHENNVDEKVRKFEEHMDRFKEAYKTKHLLVTMGGDFAYTSASSWFKNMDKLIKYVNNKQNGSFHLLYSTPSCYLNAVHAQNMTWPVKETDDYFPYGSDDHSYWTGYFTSRPALKYFVYLANNILQATKQLATTLDATSLESEEFTFKRVVAIAQHHNSVSGTGKQHVTDDCAVYLQEGINAGEKIFSGVYKKLYKWSEYPDQIFGNLRNISDFRLTEEHQNFLVTIYNPTTRRKTIPIKFPIEGNNYYQVFNISGLEVRAESVPIPSNLIRIPGRKSNATNDLIFMANDIPPLGVVSYYVQAAQAPPTGIEHELADQRPINNSVVILDNGKIQLNFNKTNGLLISLVKNGTEMPFSQNFFSYTPVKGYNYNPETRASGAFIFRPINKEPKEEFTNANIREYRGKDVFEIHQIFSDWLSQVVRLYKDSEDIEFEWLIGPLPIIEWTGIEFVTKYTTNIASNSIFYTDSNGRRWMKRTRDYRKYWNINMTEPVASNYYPLTSSICVKDSSKQLTVISDRPEGGTSMKDGEVEIMLHRRLLYDDNKGVTEPLDETAFGQGLVIRGTHVVQINNVEEAAAAHRFKAVETAYRSVPTFARTTFGLSDWLHKFNKTISLLAAELPPCMHILSLERWRNNQILLRLEHLFQANESNEHSKAVTVDIKKLFSQFAVSQVQELTLGGNLEKEKSNRKKWNYEGLSFKKTETESQATGTTDEIVLQPMQIRTFLLFTEPKS